MAYFFGRRGKGIPRDATFRLTQLGSEKLQEFKGDAESQVFLALETGGSLNSAEIAQSTGLSKGRVERILPKLIRGSYVQPVSNVMGGEEGL